MRTFTFQDGVEIDIDTGDILGQKPAEPIAAKEATQARTLNISEDPEKPVTRQAIDAIKQLSWGFNTALLSLPDDAVRAAGVALGVDEKEIPSFVKYFNRAEVAPEGMVERFANTIGKGIGAGLPFTGLLGYLGSTKALTAPLTADAGVLKRVSKEMLDFVRKDPKAAVKADVAFGGMYGALEQSVEEFMDPGEGKDIAKAVVPMAGILAVPTMLAMAGKVLALSPTVQGAKAVAGAFPANVGQGVAADFSRDETVRQMVGEKMPKIPGLRAGLNLIAGYNERQAGKKIAEILAPLNDPAKVSTQESIRITRELEDFIKNDPRLKDLNLSDRFLLDIAQSSLDGSVLAARNELIRNISGSPLTAEQLRQTNLEKVFLETFQALTPKSGMPMDQALKIAYANHMDTIAGATRRISNATEEEALMFADRFKTANLDDLGSSIRVAVMAQSEGVFSMLRKEATDIGARQATGFDNVPLPTRSKGKALSIYGPTDFEDFSRGLVNKYKLTANERIFVNQATPPPVQYLSSLLRRYDNKIERLSGDALSGVVKEYFGSKFSGGYKLTLERNPSLLDDLAPNIDTLTNFVAGKKSREATLKILGPDYPLPSPNEIKEMATKAQAQARIDNPFQITRPEALDMLEASLRYRNSAISEYNKRMDLGIKRNGAQRVLDTSNALHKDVEEFVLGTVFKQEGVIDPALAKWIDKYDDIFRKGYEKALPLLISRRRGTEDFLLSSERVVGEALKSADNVRTLTTIMGPDSFDYQQTLLKAMYDKAYRSNVMDQDGLLDPKKYQRFLQVNRSVVEAMPESVQRELRDELGSADKAVTRIAELRRRKEDMEDVELLNVLKKATRADADPQKLVLQAIDDPAIMRKLVDSLNGKPDQVEALRRQVWQGVEKELFNASNPLFMEQFLLRNSKSLNVLYTPQHLDDLRQLAEMQKRVFTGESVQGKLSPFMSFDQRLRQTVGMGVGTIEATGRAATIRQINKMHAGVLLMTRMLARQQTNAYEAVLYRALTDSKYAHELINASAPAESPKGLQQQMKLAAKVGFTLPRIVGVYIPSASRIGTIEAMQAFEDPERPIPVRERSAPLAAPQTPSMPPAPPSSAPALSQSAPARALPKMPNQGQGQYADFARLFPNDFVAPLIQQQPEQP